MSFIKSYGTALPHFRIEDNILHPKGRKGVSKAVCYTDEDIITLSYEAVKNCLTDNYKPDAIFFATSTPVFSNRYHASFIADLIGLNQNILSLDFINSSRSGTDALLMAHELLETGKYNNILVIAADVDFPGIGEELSTPFGHAACAILLSKEKGICQITSAASYSSSIAEEFDYKNKSIRLDPRFSRDEGFKKNIASSLKEFAPDSKTTDSILLNSLYTKLATPAFLKAGFKEEQFSKDALSGKIGNTGATHALLLLINEIENGKKKILLADYSNGTNFFSISVNTSPVKQFQNQMLTTENIVSYQDYLHLRKEGNFNSVKYKTKDIFSSEMMNEREKEAFIHKTGMKCDKCNTVYFIHTARCKKCKGEKFTKLKLADTGIVYSFTREHYFPVAFPPLTMAVIDLDGGGRVTLQQSNTMYPDKNNLQIGSKVKLVLRKMTERDEKPNYFFKAIAIQ